MHQEKTQSVLEYVMEMIREKTRSIQQPILIAVGGPGGCGKSTFALQLAKGLNDADVLTLDDYKTSRAARQQANIFGPHPSANKMDLIKQHLQYLKAGQSISKPVYDGVTGEALETKLFLPKRYIIVEGEVSTYPLFRDLIDFSIFIDAGLLTQLAARLGRDVQERGHSQEKAALNFLYSNLREFPTFGTPTRDHADVRLFCDQDYHLEVELFEEVCF